MDKSGEIVIIEDDQDDQELLAEVFESLRIPNKVVFFPNGTRVSCLNPSPRTSEIDLGIKAEKVLKFSFDFPNFLPGFNFHYSRIMNLTNQADWKLGAK